MLLHPKPAINKYMHGIATMYLQVAESEAKLVDRLVSRKTEPLVRAIPSQSILLICPQLSQTILKLA